MDPSDSKPNGLTLFSLKILDVLSCLLGAAFFAVCLNLHKTSIPPVLDIAKTFGLAVLGIFIVRFDLRQTKLNIPEVTANRILMSVAVLAMVGTQVIIRTIPNPDLGTNYLLLPPLMAMALLGSALLTPSIAVFSLTVVCIMLGMSGVLSADLLLTGWVGGVIGSHVVNPLRARSDLIRALTYLAAGMAVLAFIATLSSDFGPIRAIESAGWAALSAAVACSLFWIAVPFLEKAFGLVSDWSLLELCSPESPLLRELVLKAPGTYAHSVMVGNLAEHAARAIGANPTLVRTMAYYHDVGKTLRPGYFIENQQGENIHQGMPPRLSARIISAHVADGIELARTHKLPRILQDGIAQHHGDSLMAYFFHEARQQSPDESFAELEHLFRYPGPKPQTKEAAILMLADTVEAISRVMSGESSEKLETVVGQAIEEKRADGQFNESPLTLHDLQVIRLSFIKTLGALRHERIAYPESESNFEESESTHLDLKSLREENPNETTL